MTDDPAISLILDALHDAEENAMPENPDALTPASFDVANCWICGKPTVVPLTWKLRPREPNEPDPPLRLAQHARCDREMGRIEDEHVDLGEDQDS